MRQTADHGSGLHRFGPYLKSNPKLGILSIAAGVNTTQLSTWLDTALPILRRMPNTPAMVQKVLQGYLRQQPPVSPAPNC